MLLFENSFHSSWHRTGIQKFSLVVLANWNSPSVCSEHNYASLFSGCGCAGICHRIKAIIMLLEKYASTGPFQAISVDFMTVSFCASWSGLCRIVSVPSLSNTVQCEIS